MSRLSLADMGSFNEAALLLHATQTATELSGQIYKATKIMMAGDIVAIDWVNPRTSVSLLCEYFPREAISPDLNALAHVLLPQQLPFWLRCDDEPRSVSDFLTHRRWARLDFFWAMREVDQEECLCLDIPLSPTLTLMIVNMRSTYGSFTTPDRLKLQLLRPHVRQVYRRLAAQGHIQTHALVQRRAQTQVIDGRCHWPKEARELLAAQGILVLDDDLPGSIKPWFQAQQRGLEQPLELSPGVEPLSFSRGARTLTLYLLRKPEEHAYWLVLEEKEAAAATDRAFPGLDITSRESEVLYWVSQGKSNSEIATILGISGGTVGRHLENLFPKLGVANRYAAGMIASGILSMRETAAIPHHGLLHHAQSSSTG